MLKKFLLVLLVVASFFFVNTAHAHVLEAEGSIGAVMHIDPQDDPPAGVPATIFLEFKDKEGHFTTENCNCTVTVLKSEKSIYTQKLPQDSLNPTFTFTFPTTGKYDLHVSGTPINGAAFQPFTLHYDIEVAKGNSKPTRSGTIVPVAKSSSYNPPLIPIVAGILVLCGVVVFILVSYFKKK